ncbi:alpha/beta fold hydrolase [Paracraurococcus ruber]|uniref:Poly-beta-hydroxybutyrate polymerase n=1 Tax=Paracraurococcus ruber TaxID=77675 RepID=A0ABS1CY18_9PROT|nr:alpha/beta fold hydrolase [Paracraurococcus ruber]MBK1659382.1 poly-beta-hydroxybutyrate polymerase [Paracraurococcus ruber]TDG27109.1 alpha/beta hydrolase [Paracraurococcus ruber]
MSPARPQAARPTARPTPRLGPRPLALHLGLSLATRWAARMPPPCTPASPSWNGAWPRSNAGRREAARIADALAAAGHPPEAFAAAVERRLLARDLALAEGILAYRRHPFRRDLADPPMAWAEGGSRLLDYGGAVGPALLVVPSLINRAAVLDLLPEASMLRHLAGQGLRVLLLDWGMPGPAERCFTLTDYVAGRLRRAIAAATRIAGQPPVLVGYCMGGMLALAAAQRLPGALRGLALLATPWDFWAGDAARAQSLAATLPLWEPAMQATGALPVDVLQALFAALDPAAIGEKFRAFRDLDPESPQARRFVALEDWLNDGVPLAAPVAREALGSWYGGNAPLRGAWRIAGAPVTPRSIRLPCFVAIPARDRIVPPSSALALADRLPAALVHHAAAGHVGMVAGSAADVVLWRPLLTWIKALPA